MSTELDIDDVAATSPLAAAELADLRASAARLALERAEFRIEAERLRALADRQRAWIDGVAAQESTVSQYYDAIGRRHFTRLGETAEQIGYTCQPLITRPAPFEDK